jgi:hypothetical protein
MGHRRERLDRRQADAAVQKGVNAVRKAAESTRRDARMLDIIKKGSLPYTPDVMSWLSRKLEKPSTKITAEDVATLS